MCSKNIGFLLTIFVACLVSNAFAASSVRALGANNTGSNIATASPLNNASVISTGRKSSLPLNRQQVSTVWGQDTKASNEASTTKPVSTNRLSIITKNMQNLQKQMSNTTPASGASSSGAATAAISDVLNKIDALQDQIADIKNNVSDLSNYYTKQELDELSHNYYTSNEVDEKLHDIESQLSDMGAQVQEIGNSTSVQQIQQLAATVESHTTQIQNIQAASDPTVVFDPETNERKTNVAVVDVFDPDILDGN